MAGDGPKIKPEEEPKEGEKEKRLVFDRSLGTAAGLSKLLPTGTTLAFQTMAPSFTNSGECEDHDVNFAFTWGLVGFLTLLCALLCFTDSVRDDDGNIHYGVATPSGFKLFGHHFRDLKMANQDKRSLRRRKRLKPQDFVHALMSAAVFVALAFSDAGVQQCLVPMDSAPWKGFLTHLPLAVAFLASIVFIVFPSTRTGVGDDSAWSGWDTSSKDAEAAKEKPQQQEKKKRGTFFHKSLASAAGLSKLLPTGTTLAFQTMAPSFTKGGKCNGHGVNFAFTWGLVGFLTFLSALISFTDSVTDKHGDTYYGLATCDGFLLFDKDKEQEYSSPSSPDDGSDVMSRKIWWEDIKRKKKLRPQDYVNALIRAAVFMALAFCDAGVQDCLVPKESRQWRDFLAILPLAVGFLASFVFIIFPSNRKGIGAEGDSVVDLDAAKSHEINPKDKSEKP